MDIYSYIPDEEYPKYDGFLSFLGMYEDHRRITNYRRGLKRFRHLIKKKVAVEAGAGFGIFTEYMLKLGASRVYAVEENELMLKLLKKKFANEPRVKIVEGLIEDFEPDEEIDFLVHDFWGSLLYDENLISLERLKFKPKVVFPDRGELRYGVFKLEAFNDKIVTPEVLNLLEGVLVSDLIPTRELPLKNVAYRWKFGRGLKKAKDALLEDGEVLVFGIKILHGTDEICRSHYCYNWPYIWTKRVGKRFDLTFWEREPGYIEPKIKFFETESGS